MPVADEIHGRLQAAFNPTHLDVTDDSEAHRGHAGYQDGGESHFNVTIAAPDFARMSRLQRHRAIHAAIGPDIMVRIHALAIDVRA